MIKPKQSRKFVGSVRIGNNVAMPTQQHGSSPDAFKEGAGLSPQQWWEVVAPPSELAERCAALMPHSQELSCDELQELVQQIADSPDLWEPLVIVDPERRRYRLLYEDDRIDVWVLSWMEDQGTGYHDHGASRVGLACAAGAIEERQMILPTGASRVEMEPGISRQGDAGYIHSVAFLKHGAESSPAVSIHAYSPPLTQMGQYRVDEDGILFRHNVHGRQELLDHSIAHVDPERAAF
jgi:hypothetical protein